MIGSYILLIFIGFSGGVIVAGGVFAFIAIIGVVPRLAQKTCTQKYMTIYEDSIMIGGILGTIVMISDISLNIGIVATILYGFFAGIFVGSLAVSLAEVLDVIPILTRRLHIKIGMSFFIVSLALGKLTGSLLYWLIPGFFNYKN
ncbi:MAG: stage V sporulation protein AB [Vallitalea sp.]|jgi:stage V sporulation protein AB|nr:stage V sporulation protein AB [Vallitalea sp.]